MVKVATLTIVILAFTISTLTLADKTGTGCESLSTREACKSSGLDCKYNQKRGCFTPARPEDGAGCLVESGPCSVPRCFPPHPSCTKLSTKLVWAHEPGQTPTCCEEMCVFTDCDGTDGAVQQPEGYGEAEAREGCSTYTTKKACRSSELECMYTQKKGCFTPPTLVAVSCDSITSPKACKSSELGCKFTQKKGCIPIPTTTCLSLEKRGKCIKQDGCTWAKKTCLSSSTANIEVACADTTKRSQCKKREDCHWKGGACHIQVPCDSITKRGQCNKRDNCSWERGACHIQMALVVPPRTTPPIPVKTIEPLVVPPQITPSMPVKTREPNWNGGG